MRRLTTGGWGWVAVPILVAVVDGHALREHALGRTAEAHTMSRSFFIAIHHPLRRWPVSVGVVSTLWHLTTGWNPLARIGNAWIAYCTPTQGEQR